MFLETLFHSSDFRSRFIPVPAQEKQGRAAMGSIQTPYKPHEKSDCAARWKRN
jgi:hypothetical protein